jgi:hypothetical protein
VGAEYQLLPSGLPALVADSERLSRFLVFRKWFNPEGDYVKPAAFLPDQNLETSVFRATDLADVGVWPLAEDAVIHREGAALHGRADIFARNVRAIGLEIHAQEPPPRHADLTGWAREKDAQKSRAQQLSAAAKLVIRQ